MKDPVTVESGLVASIAETWATLDQAAEPGTHFRALDPFIPLRATINLPSRRLGLQIHVPEQLAVEPGQLRSSTQIEIQANVDDHGTLIRLELVDSKAVDLFKRLCDDIIPRALSQKSGAAAALTLVRRFATWQRFLKASAVGGLTKERQLGLIGELWTLESLLLANTDPYRAVNAWTGPDGAPQDFQIDGIGIEVKSIVHSEPQTLRIDGERQLDDFGLVVLVVAHHRVLKHQDAGESLPVVVDRIRATLATLDGPIDTFDDKVLSYGYADDDAAFYSSTGYSVKETSYYKVEGGFPRLTEDDLVPGLGKLVYSIDASACMPFLVEPETLLRWLSEPPTIKDPSSSEESVHVEYKQTAWTPVGPTQNDEHRANVQRSLRSSIIKTVVAFLNGEGGELIIGVDDTSRQVTGIEPDLSSRGRQPDDVDFYEREIVTLLMDGIDNTVHRQVRVAFTTHDEKVACHIRVRPSPSPRFGRAPAPPNERRRPVFWVRAGNTTQQLEGEDILAYIHSHWS